MTSSAPPLLRVVCVNDVYELTNLPRLKTLVRGFAASEPAVPLLCTLAGDFLAPSLLSSLDHGRGMIDCLNDVPVTHVVLGNHEDDLPFDELQRRIREFRGVWLNGNVRGLEPALPPTQVLALRAHDGRAVRVGLLGVVMHDPTIYRRPPFGGHPIEPANEAALRLADALVRDERCDVVLALTHQAADDDRALAREAAARGLPLVAILGGHEHTAIVEQHGPTLLVKTGADATHAAVLELRLGTEGAIALAHALRALDAVPEDEALRARAATHLRAVRELEAAVLLHLEPGEALSSVGTRREQTSMGAMVCSRLRDALGAELCLFNGGGIRGKRSYERRFTFGDLKTEVPFDNEVVVARLPGAVVRDALAASRARAPDEWGGFLQCDDGLTVDPRTNELLAVQGAPLDPAREYRVALVRDLLLGMDKLGPLAQYGASHPERVPPAGSGRETKLLLIESFARSLWRKLGPFDALDTDGDGSLSAPDVASALTALTREPASPVTVELLVRTADTNRDTLVSRAEAAALDAPRADGDPG